MAFVDSGEPTELRMRMMMTWPMRMMIALIVAMGAMRGAGQWVTCVEADGRVVVEARHEMEVCPPCDATAQNDIGEEPCEDLLVPDAKASMEATSHKQIAEMQCVPAVLVQLPVLRAFAIGARAAEVRGDPPRPMVVSTVILLV